MVEDTISAQAAAADDPTVDSKTCQASKLVTGHKSRRCWLLQHNIFIWMNRRVKGSEVDLGKHLH